MITLVDSATFRNLLLHGQNGTRRSCSAMVGALPPSARVDICARVQHGPCFCMNVCNPITDERELPCSYPCRDVNQTCILAYPVNKNDKFMQTTRCSSRITAGQPVTVPVQRRMQKTSLPVVSVFLCVMKGRDSVVPYEAYPQTVADGWKRGFPLLTVQIVHQPWWENVTESGPLFCLWTVAKG